MGKTIKQWEDEFNKLGTTDLKEIMEACDTLMSNKCIAEEYDWTGISVIGTIAKLILNKKVKENMDNISSGSNFRAINETRIGNCEVCGKNTLLDKGYGTKWACEECYYKIGNQTVCIEIDESLKKKVKE